MKVLGIGVDIIQNKRIKVLIKNNNFIKRIYGKNEIEFSKKITNKENYFAKRFAAKESLSKALGTGFRNKLNYKDIQIFNNNLGKPYYHISPKIKNMVNNKFKIKNFNLFLSISDEKDYSIAFTILQVQ